MSEPSINTIVGFVGGRVWYRLIVTATVMSRAVELAAGHVGPDWRRVDAAGLDLVVETVDPSWFEALGRGLAVR
jgi:hypothetical protein